MRHTVFYGSSVLAVAAMVAALLVWPAAGEAQLGGIVPGGTLPGTTTVLSDPGTRAAATSDALPAAPVTGRSSPLPTGEGLRAVADGRPEQMGSQRLVAAC